MNKNILDVILHPIRMRILMTIVGRELTAGQIASALPDIAQATLYRHINTLADKGILLIVAERQVRGTVEKMYALDHQAVNPTAEEIAAMSKEDHLRYFTTFATMLISDFARYLENADKVDFVADGVSYRHVPLFLSDAELREVSQEMAEIMKSLLANKPSPERKRHVFTTIVIPSTDEDLPED